MQEKVKEYLRFSQLPPQKANVLAACSGGPDSLALVHLLHQLRQEKFWDGDLAVAHVNHRLRPEAAQEAEFVEAFCRERNLVCHQAVVDVRAYLRQHRCSLQEAARILRYQVLGQIAAPWGDALIATGHHQDDQAETVLLQLFRGAGLDGLKGMRPLQGKLFRPLLTVGRDEIEEYCRLQGWQPCRDPSNLKVDYLRNRLRLELLPEIEKKYNGRIRETLGRTALILADVQDYMREQAEDFLLREGRELEDGGFFCRQASFAVAHPALQRQILRRLIEKKRGCLTGISFGHVEKTRKMFLQGQVGNRMILPGGLLLRCSYDGVVVGGAGEELASGLPKPLAVLVPGNTHLRELGMVLTARILPGVPAKCGERDAIFDLEQLKLPLYVRTRQDGDRFEPLGMSGSKKVQDYFTDVKIPRRERDRIPLICDQGGILWIGGWRQDRRGRGHSGSQRILHLALQNVADFNGEDDRNAE